MTAKDMERSRARAKAARAGVGKYAHTGSYYRLSGRRSRLRYRETELLQRRTILAVTVALIFAAGFGYVIF